MRGFAPGRTQPVVYKREEDDFTRPLSLFLHPRPCIVSRFEVCNVKLVTPHNHIHIFRILDLESYAWYQLI